MRSTRHIRVGCRRSSLAIAQSEEILTVLRSLYPELVFKTVPIATQGDRNPLTPLKDLERGSFAKDIEVSLLNGGIDIAIHSAKDLTIQSPKGLVLAALNKRLDPRDVLINKWNLTLSDLPEGARIGTSSPRRTAQIKHLRPDLNVIPIRGNVDSRIRKIQSREYDGIILAAAGLIRLNRSREITEYLDPDSFLPEIGQGALAIQVRSDDHELLDMMKYVNHTPTFIAVTSERSFQKVIGGGCTIPVTAFSEIIDSNISLKTMAAKPDGSQIFTNTTLFDINEPEQAGVHAANLLISSGAGGILDRDTTYE